MQCGISGKGRQRGRGGRGAGRERAGPGARRPPTAPATRPVCCPRGLFRFERKPWYHQALASTPGAAVCPEAVGPGVIIAVVPVKLSAMGQGVHDAVTWFAKPSLCKADVFSFPWGEFLWFSVDAEVDSVSEPQSSESLPLPAPCRHR